MSDVRLTLALLWMLTLSAGIRAQDREQYIRQYQDIAIAEMQRAGIPASIKLAQAMLESNCGTSDLACKANNHFGIKCGGGWTGGTFHKEDDDYQNGKLVPSCFREFSSPVESFIAHSDFLKDPRKAHRYGPLFHLDPRDYKGWAHGLSKAGYATDPNYPQRLIRLIEQFELHRFDNYPADEVFAQASTPPPLSPKPGAGRRAVREVNGVRYVTALEHDQLAAIAEFQDIKLHQVIRYNDNTLSPDKLLAAGTRVFVENKRASFKGRQESHKLKPGEDLATVSQLYGIKLKSLLKRNGLKSGQHPAAGQRIALRGRIRQPLRTADPYQPPVDTPEAPPVLSPGPTAERVTKPTSPDTSPRTVTQAEAEIRAAMQHEVSPGDTLFGIARKYGMSVDELKKKNKLSADTIQIGQKLVVQ